jgi:hypothetical protein
MLTESAVAAGRLTMNVGIVLNRKRRLAGMLAGGRLDRMRQRRDYC